jgi:hypothetical protein
VSAWFVGHPSEADLALFAGGEAGPLSRWRVERHLETCPECKRTVAEFFRLRDRIGPLHELPDIDWIRFAEVVELRISEDSIRAPWRPPPSLRWAWPAVAVATIVLASVLVKRQEPAEAPVADIPASVAFEALAKATAAKEDAVEMAAAPAVPMPAARSGPAAVREAAKPVAPEPATPALSTDILALAPPPAPAGRSSVSVRERLRGVFDAGGRDALEAEARTLAERARETPDALDEEERTLADLYATRGLDALVAELAAR